MELSSLKDYLAKFKAINRSITPLPYQGFLKTLREFQHKALEACDKDNTRGRVTAPCGCGKTCIQQAWHVGDMLERSLAGEFGVYVIASHRLILNNQLLGRVLELIIECRIPCDVLYVGSMNVSLDEYYIKYAGTGFSSKVCNCISSTDQKVIEKFIADARPLNRNVLVVSTYDSIGLLENIGDIRQCSYDEAHNTLAQGFTKNIARMSSHVLKSRFFTATPKKRGDNGGMNDTSVYGEWLYDYAPRDARIDSEICYPRVSVVDAIDPDNTTTDKNVNMHVRSLIEAYKDHSSKVLGRSVDADSIAPKILVSASGIQEMEDIYFNHDFQSFAKDNNITIAAISSDGCYFNGEKYSRSKFMELLLKIAYTEAAIIFNVDILTEGFDLPAITGVMLHRNMSNTRLLQLLGRCLRLHREDRARLYSGELTPGDYANYVKPYGYIIIPRHLQSVSDHKWMIECIQEIMTAYETKAEELMVQETFKDTHHDQLESVIPFDPNSGRMFDLIVTEINLKLLLDNTISMRQPQKKAYIEKLTGELNA